jgi:predicted nucleic acid-binding Zn ribbon protein
MSKTKTPEDSYFCCNCGKALKVLCIYTCKINDHYGSMIYCEKCMADAKKVKEAKDGR